jgi:hypothetical protein
MSCGINKDEKKAKRKKLTAGLINHSEESNNLYISPYNITDIK